MNMKRWLAILAVAVLLFISLGFRVVTSFSSSMQKTFFDESFLNEAYFEEEIILEGKSNSQIAVLNVSGVIQGGDGGSVFAPAEYNQQDLLNKIYYAAEKNSVKAIVIEIDSPGGAVFETAQIHRALIEMQEQYEKPIYVSMGSMAASGGYYIAAPADKIFAEPSTLTGSIGVIMESINYSKLAEKYGVDFNTIKSGKHKDIMSPSKEMTTDEREILQSIIDEMYDDFVNVIVDGRGLDEKKVREISDGRIYTGRQAKTVGLVDEIGSLDDTIYTLMEDYNLEGSQVIAFNSVESFFNIFKVNIPSVFGTNNSELEKIMGLLEQSDKPRAMYLY